MTSNVSKVSKLSLVKGLVYANSNLTTHACAREGVVMSPVRCYKRNPDGTLRFVGVEHVKVVEHHWGWRRHLPPDGDSLRTVSDIDYNGAVNSDDRE